VTTRKTQQAALFAPPTRGVARVRRFVDRQIRAQRDVGQLEPVDDGLVGIVMTMADAIDRQAVGTDGSDYTVLMGCKNLADVLLKLRGSDPGAGADDGPDVELAALVAAIRDAAGP
jgi:hypothetical protein